jgi:hypothetical protein
MAASWARSASRGAHAAVFAAAIALLTVATPAKANWHGARYGYHGSYRGGWHPGWGGPYWRGGPRWGVVVAPPAYYPWRRPYYPPPVYYAPPPVYYAPPPVYYAAPPPVVYTPGIALGLTVR